MEGLTLAAVNHLPSACVFVMDLSGTCGAQSAPELQLAVRAAARRVCGRRERSRHLATAHSNGAAHPPPRWLSQVRDQIRAEFPDRPWLDVRSKADLPLAEGIAPEQVRGVMAAPWSIHRRMLFRRGV